MGQQLLHGHMAGCLESQGGGGGNALPGGGRLPALRLRRNVCVSPGACVHNPQDEQRQWGEQLAEGQGQLRAARAALRALEKKVAGLQAEVQAEQARRQAAEQQKDLLLEQLRQQADQLAAHQAREQAQLEAQREREQEKRRRAAGAPPVAAGPPPGYLAAGAGGEQERPAAPAPAAAQPAAPTASDAVLLHHMLQLQQEVAAIKVGAQHMQHAQQAQQATAAPPSPEEYMASRQAGSPGWQPQSSGMPAALPATAGWAAQGQGQVQQQHAAAGPQHLPSLVRQPTPSYSQSGSPTRCVAGKPAVWRLYARLSFWLPAA